MPEYLAPGVYVEEVSFRSKSIEGVPTSTTGYAGIVARLVQEDLEHRRWIGAQPGKHRVKAEDDTRLLHAAGTRSILR